MPSTLVAFRITSALISIARSAAAVSVLKYGLPVPAPNTTTRPFSRWRIARRRMNGSATARISMAVTTRCARRVEHVRDRHLRVANRRLVRQHDLLIKAPELALDDLVEHVGRLAGVLHLRPVDRPLFVEDRGWHRLARHVARAGRRDL